MAQIFNGYDGLQYATTSHRHSLDKDFVTMANSEVYPLGLRNFGNHSGNTTWKLEYALGHLDYAN